ncbi:MAG: hypothetical protein R3C14_46455 [Caldilineaceae bacterium]
MLKNELAATLALDGEWQFQLGEEGAWQTITVPGCWEAQGYSNACDGPARYRCTVLIPAAWTGQPISWECDAVSYAATFFCNGRQVGAHEGLWTPFALDISDAVQPGMVNTLEIVVWKPSNQLTGGRYPLRTTLAGFLPDVATTFGGLWQSTRLRLGATGFTDLRVEPEVESGALQVQGRFHHHYPQPAAGPLTLQLVVARGRREVARISRLLSGDQLDVTLHVPGRQRWSPRTPVCYQLYVTVRLGSQLLATQRLPFGFRRLATAGEQLLLNGEPICLRGALSWGWDPARIAPCYAADQVRAEFKRLRAQGFNLVKLCLFIPNQMYYEIADEEGMLLWQEWPMWLPAVTDDLRRRAPAEYAAYVELTRHHPAVVLYSLGCELNQQVDAPLLGELDAIVRRAAKDVLVCDNSGSGEAYGGLTVDLADFTDYHTYGDIHFLAMTLDHWRRDWQPPRPWIFGEFCDADGFRDLQELVAANGGVRPWWMTAENPTAQWRPEVRALVEADARLRRADLPFTTQQLVQIANAQAFVVRKYTLETVRQRVAVQGYVITGLRDTPIATSGIFDDLDRPKWEPAAFRHFNDDAILSLEVGRRRRWQHGGDRADRLDLHNWTTGSAVQLHVILHHTAPATLQGGRLAWQVTTPAGEVIAQAQQAVTAVLPAGRPQAVGAVDFTLPAWSTATALHLTVNFTSGALQVDNQWPLWCYPQREAWLQQAQLYDPAYTLAEIFGALPMPLRPCSDPALCPPDQVLITDGLDRPLLSFLAQGGRVLLLQQRGGPLPVQRQPFWREAVKLIMPHPCWAGFPHAGFVDLQFFGLATDVAFAPAALPASLPQLTHYQPLLRRLDAREFTVSDYLFLAQCGAGRLLGCTLRLQGGAGVQPTGLQRNVTGRYLLAELVTYLRGT